MSNTPQIRFAGFTDAWEQRKLSDTLDFLSNNTLSRAELSEDTGTYKNVHYGDVLIKFGEYIDAQSTDLPYIADDEKAKKFESSKLQDGDIIIADTAEDEAVGKCVEIGNIGDLSIVSGLHTIPCRPKVKFATAYLGFYLNSASYHDQLIPLMQGIKVTSISKSAISDTMISAPTNLSEQGKIGQFFTQLDSLITLHQRKCDALQKFKKSMLQKMFPQNGESVPEIRFAGFTDAWEQRKLSDLFEERNEQAPMDEEYPLMAFIANIGVAPKGDRYDRSALVHDEKGKKYKRTEKGDFIYSSNNLETGSIGLNNYGNACISPVYSIFKSKHTVDPEFMGRILLRKEFINQMVSFRQGVVYGQWKIHEDDFLNLDILVPKTTEQQKIGDYFRNLDSLITLHQRKLETLQKMKKSLLQKMFV